MVLEKCRERVSVWKCFAGKGDTVAGLMSRIVRLEKERVLSLAERTVLTQFLICAFSGLEVDAVRQVRGRRSVQGYPSCHHHHS